MKHPFDELTKALAHELPRRQALRQLGGGLATALLASLGLGEAWGQARGCTSYCLPRISPRVPKALKSCVTSCQDCLKGGGDLCGVSAMGAVICCGFGLFCIDGACRPAPIQVGCGSLGKICGAGEKCCANTLCIPSASVCCPNSAGTGVLTCLPGTTCCASRSPTLPSAVVCCKPGEFCCPGEHDVNCCPPDEECNPETGKCRVPL